MSEPIFVKEVERVDYFDDRTYNIALTIDQSVELISTTTYLDIAPKPYLIPFYKKNTAEEIDRRFREGQVRGSRLHWAFYVLSRGGVPLFQPPDWKNPNKKLTDQNNLIAQQCRNSSRMYCYIADQDEWLQVKRVEKWFKVVKPKLHYAELVVWSLEHQMAGTLDIVAEIKRGKYNIQGSKNLELYDGLYIADYKTGNVDVIVNFAQLASYLMCLKEDLPEVFNQIEGGMIIQPDASTRAGEIPGLTTIYKSKDDILKEDWPYFQHIQALWRRHHPNFKAEHFDFETYAVLDEDFVKDVITGQAPNPKADALIVQVPVVTKEELEKSQTDLDREDMLLKVAALCESVYTGKKKSDAAGRDTLIQRAFRLNGKPIVETYAEAGKLTLEQLRAGFETLQNDVVTLASHLGGGGKP